MPTCNGKTFRFRLETSFVYSWISIPVVHQVVVIRQPRQDNHSRTMRCSSNNISVWLSVYGHVLSWSSKLFRYLVYDCQIEDLQTTCCDLPCNVCTPCQSKHSCRHSLLSLLYQFNFNPAEIVLKLFSTWKCYNWKHSWAEKFSQQIFVPVMTSYPRIQIDWVINIPSTVTWDRFIKIR